MAKKRPELVRYVSPFGSPAWMTRETAARHLAADDDRWLRFQSVGMLSAAQREVGPPRIEVPK